MYYLVVHETPYWFVCKLSYSVLLFQVGKAATALPRIIGGSDLVVHENKPRKELDAWLREATEVRHLIMAEVEWSGVLFNDTRSQ